MTVPAQRRAPVGAQQYREAMAVLAAPVCVVTTRLAGESWGMTASTVTGISLDPPLVAVAVGHTAGCHEALTRSSEFAVSVLGDHQRHLAVRFSTRGIDRFAGDGLTTLTGTDLPVIADAAAHYRCTRHDVVTIGDHDLLIGELTDFDLRGGERPLIWFRRAFHAGQPTPDREEDE